MGRVRPFRDPSQGLVAVSTSRLSLSLAASCRHGAHGRPGYAWRCSLRRCVCEGRRNSGRQVLPRPTRPALGRRLRIQAKVRQDLLDGWPLDNPRDGLDLARSFAFGANTPWNRIRCRRAIPPDLSDRFPAAQMARCRRRAPALKRRAETRSRAACQCARPRACGAAGG